MKKIGKIWILFGFSILFVSLLFLSLFNQGFAGSQEEGDFEYECNFEDLPSEFELKLGEPFSLNINSPEGFVFSDNSEMIDISKETGVVYFSPSEIGEFPVVFIALKDVEDFQYKVVRFRVVE